MRNERQMLIEHDPIERFQGLVGPTQFVYSVVGPPLPFASAMRFNTIKLITAWLLSRLLSD